MKQSPQIQARINTIAKELASGKDRDEIVSKYCKKFHLSKRQVDNYIKSAKIIAGNLSEKANKAASDTFIEETIEAVKNGLKTKIERQMILQGEVDKILQELEANVSTDYVVLSGKLQKVKKEIPVTDRAYLRRVLKDLQAEISKMEADYAPDKLEHSGSIVWKEMKNYKKE
jgi:hypothetical protein